MSVSHPRGLIFYLGVGRGNKQFLFWPKEIWWDDYQPFKPCRPSDLLVSHYIIGHCTPFNNDQKLKLYNEHPIKGSACNEASDTVNVKYSDEKPNSDDNLIYYTIPSPPPMKLNV